LDLWVPGVRSTVWATGYRRRHPWLHLPVLDAAGDIRRTAGITPAPGLVVIGQQRQTRPSSTFLDGPRHDAAIIVEHLLRTVLAKPLRRAS
jgi:putative flavoprotein involved in K+ transport